MNFLFELAAISCPVFIATSSFLYISLRRARQFEVRYAALNAQTESLRRDADEVRSLRQQHAELLEQKAVATSQLQESEKKLQSVLTERNTFMQQKELALASQAQTEQRLALMQQHLADVEKRMQDWELQREEFLKITQASILETSGQVSNKLLEDHKREAEAAKKEAEEAAKKNAQGLLEQMLSVTQSVAALKEQNAQTQHKVSTIWRSLTTPGGAGQLAEIGLENSLKHLKLEAGRDYVMQYVVSGAEAGSLRPDAVIFLPQDMVMVIDSKASKFLLEIAEAEAGGTDEAELLRKFADTMNKHVQDLKTKGYELAIRAAYKAAGRSSAISAMHMVMCVPSEAAIDQIKRADPAFMSKAQKYGIIIASPASLQGLLSLASHNIGLMRQSENYDLIMKSVQQLMDNVITVLSYAEGVGKGLKSAALSFDEFARSVNKRLLPKVRQLATHGIKPSKEIPGRITSYEMHASNEMLTIEGESETVEEAGVIEAFPKKASA